MAQRHRRAAVFRQVARARREASLITEVAETSEVAEDARSSRQCVVAILAFLAISAPSVLKRAMTQGERLVVVEPGA